jgi:hypothetical protein
MREEYEACVNGRWSERGISPSVGMTAECRHGDGRGMDRRMLRARWSRGGKCAGGAVELKESVGRGLEGMETLQLVTSFHFNPCSAYEYA